MLKQALVANAVFSGFSGIVLLVARDQLTTEIAAPPDLFLLLGVGLIGFSAQLALMALRPALARKLALEVVLADLAWVVVTSLALAIFRSQVTATGTLLIVAVNVVVAGFAALQYAGLVRVRRAA